VDELLGEDRADPHPRWRERVAAVFLDEEEAPPAKGYTLDVTSGPTMHRMLKRAAAKEFTNPSAYVRRAVAEALSRSLDVPVEQVLVDAPTRRGRPRDNGGRFV